MNRIKCNGILAFAELLITLPIFTLILVFLFEAWKFVYWQNAINQTTNYAVSYWSKNDSPSCNNIEAWLKQVTMPILKKYNLNPGSITFTAKHQNDCNCAGAEISLESTIKTWKFNYLIKPPRAYAIAIKEGAPGENCK